MSKRKKLVGTLGVEVRGDRSTTEQLENFAKAIKSMSMSASSGARGLWQLYNSPGPSQLMIPRGSGKTQAAAMLRYWTLTGQLADHHPAEIAMQPEKARALRQAPNHLTRKKLQWLYHLDEKARKDGKMLVVTVGGTPEAPIFLPEIVEAL